MEVESLYRYTSWSDRTKSVLEDERIWFSKMSEFNDPFEGIYDINTDAKPESIVALAVKSMADDDRTWADIAKNIKENVLEDDFGGLPIKKAFRENLNKSVEDLKNKIKDVGVLSLSEDPLSILMWSHYADEHKGICIEFGRSPGEMSMSHIHCRPVKYSREYPIPSLWDILSEEHLLTNKAVFTKSIHWAYEKEWRIWEERGNYLHPTPGPIRSIILGKNWCGNLFEMHSLASENDAKLMRAKIIKNEYDLELVEEPYPEHE